MIGSRLGSRLWRVWSKALGPKEGANKKEADIIALVRTVVFFSYMITNACIILNTWRHWDHQ